MELESQRKKRKIIVTTMKYVNKIIEMHPTGKKWLVEWSDKTRTWETYDIVKDLQIFQDFLQYVCNTKNVNKIPSYIS